MIYGWTYGIWFAFFLFKYARPFFQVHIRRMLETGGKEFALHHKVGLTKEALQQVIIALVVWIVMMTISGLLFYFASINFSYPEEWIRHIIACNGGEEGLSPNKMFSNSAFISTGAISSLFGAYFGIMLDSMYLNGTP